MNDCEIVENTACGQAFKYCRTHKVEPQDCPGAKSTAVQAGAALQQLANFEIAPRYAAPKREFKVGDRVKVNAGKSMVSTRLAGTVCTVASVGTNVYTGGSVLFLAEDIGGLGVWADEVEHA